MSKDITRLTAAAQRLREQHKPGNPLILVNAWDVASARQVEAAGALAVATSSAAVTAALGEQDNNTARAPAFAALRRITRAVGIPVTADIEAGYGLAGGELVEALLDAGAVGCNIEDTDHTTGASLRDAGAQAGYLAEVRAAATAAGVPIVINARIDTIVRHPQRDAKAVMQETVRRALLYSEAGADCVYPIGLSDPILAAQLVRALDRRPVNVNLSDPLSALAEAGAARVSVGAGAFRFLMADFERRARNLLAGDATAFS
jgi:2-methylisocitrate lyase-like PEP mutase family enzyme